MSSQRSLTPRCRRATQSFGLHEIRHRQSAPDEIVWRWAISEHRVVVSKDEDFLFLANRPGYRGQLLWIRLGNCRRSALVDAVARSLDAVVSAFKAGERIVELA